MLVNNLPGFRFYRAPADEGAGAGAGAAGAADSTIVKVDDAAGAAGAKGGEGAGDAGAAAGAAKDAGAAADAGGKAGEGAAAKPDAAAVAAAAKAATDAAAAANKEWPADWRVKGLAAAGLPVDDKKALALLDRLGSPGDLVKKVIEQEKIIAQGKHKTALTKDSTAEEIAAFRKDNGIPETIDKYDLTLPDGLVIGEGDKPIIDNMLAVMHAQNMTNGAVKEVLAAYYKQEAAILQQRSEEISANKKVQEDLLRKEWGDDFRTNVNAVDNLGRTFSAETKAALAGAMDSEGYPLLNNPAFLKDMVLLARTVNPIDTVVTAGGGNQMSSVEDEIKAIEAEFGGTTEQRDAYFKDQKKQARYLELLDWREKQKKVA